MTTDSLKRALRTFIVAFLVLFLPGLLGWLNAITAWAGGQGSTPFPDAHGLLYLAVAATVAGVMGLVNLILNWLEDVTGVHLLRPAPADEAPPADSSPATVALHGDPSVEAPELGEH